MQKAAILGERRAAWVEAATPQPKEDWALVKVHVTPMCTEYKAWLGGHPTEYLGHEAAGEVVAVAQPGHVKVGDRVVVQPLDGCGRCRYCLSGAHIYCQDAIDFAAVHGSAEGSATYAQYLLKPGWLLSPIPDDMTYDEGSLALCALGPSFGAFERMGLSAGDTVLITGAGPVGLGAVLHAAYRHARALVVEGHPWRAERARALGAEAVLDPNDADTPARIAAAGGGRGVDQALDCTGVPAAQRLCIDGVRRRGQVAFVGECFDRELPVRVSQDMLRKGLTLHGSWHYNIARFPSLMDMIRRSRAMDHLVSHVLPMSEIQRAFEISASHDSAKILLHPWD